MSRDKRLFADFVIEGGSVTFDVQNGDGANCKVLAEVFFDGDDDLVEVHPKNDGLAQANRVRQTT